jgi:hypothetical protein
MLFVHRSCRDIAGIAWSRWLARAGAAILPKAQTEA